MSSQIAAILILSFIGFGCASNPVRANSQQQVESAISIEIVEDTPRTREAKAALEKLLSEYDVAPFYFTKRVQIQSGVKSHSHPILTLNTRYIHNPDRLFSTFLHEQIHWYLDSHKMTETNAAIDELKKMFPNIPSDTGARDTYSTYLHLIVCWLELQADKHYLGKEKAYALIASSEVYAWIYKQVLAKEGELRVLYERLKIAAPETGLPMVIKQRAIQ